MAAPVRSLAGPGCLARQLNVAGAGPLGTAARDTLVSLVDAHHRGGWGGRDTVLDLHARARAQVATLLGTDPGLVSFQPSVSAVVTMLARSVELRPGDEVLTWEVEFPSNLRAWAERARACGARLVTVPVPLDEPWSADRLAERVGPRTRVVTVSSVQSLDGSVTDLAPLRAACDRVGALLLVDLSQQLGVVPVDVAAAGADAAYSPTHKWLLGPVGLAVLAVRPELLAALQPPAYGAGSVDPATAAASSLVFDPDAPLREDVGRLEAGTPALLSAVAAGAAARALTDAGVAEVQEAALAARAALVEVLARHGLAPLGTASPDGPASPILAVAPPAPRSAGLVAALRSRGVQHVVRGPVLRLAPWALDAGERVLAARLLDEALA